jgi:hypothetical protein
MARRQLFRYAAVLALVGATASQASAQGTTSPLIAAEATLTEPRPEAAIEVRRDRPQWLLPMHIATITMQALDAHSTYSALRHSNVVEMNPLMKGMADNTATLVAVKAGVAAAVVYSTEKLTRRHRFAAFATALAVNSVYAMVVARNYSIAARATPTTGPR